MKMVNPFYVTGVFLYTSENVRKPLVFLYFRGVYKETSGMKWNAVFTSNFDYVMPTWVRTFFLEFTRFFKIFRKL